MESRVKDWWNNRRNEIFVIAGYAGCGKTTFARTIPELLDLKNVKFLAPTGKASILLGEGASTIHSYLYDVTKDIEDELVFHRRHKNEFDEDLLIIDEISMVSEDLLNDLKYLEIPIVGLGDPEQLPPVDGESTILNNPDMLLTKVHRMDGGLLKLATDIRSQNKLAYKYDDVTFTTRSLSRDLSSLTEDTIIIAKFNKTRRKINELVRRELRGYHLLLHQGEKLIITKNNKESGLMNGSIVTVLDILKVDVENSLTDLRVVDDFGRKLRISASIGGLVDKYLKREGPEAMKIHEIDYAYAITCHKAQGSEFDRVFVINEGRTFTGHRNWLYTAVTRAKKELKIYYGV